MAKYRWEGPTREDGVVLDSSLSIPNAVGNRHWNAFLVWEAEGNTPDVWKDRAELEVYALGLLMEAYNAELVEYDTEPQTKKATKLAKALRKEQKGTADASDLKILDDNDLVDNWMDAMEVRMEQDEQWIEQTATDQELTDYDPSGIVWPVYPV